MFLMLIDRLDLLSAPTIHAPQLTRAASTTRSRPRSPLLPSPPLPSFPSRQEIRGPVRRQRPRPAEAAGQGARSEGRDPHPQRPEGRRRRRACQPQRLPDRAPGPHGNHDARRIALGEEDVPPARRVRLGGGVWQAARPRLAARDGGGAVRRPPARRHHGGGGRDDHRGGARREGRAARREG